MFIKYWSIGNIFSGTILHFGQLSKEAKESRNKDTSTSKEVIQGKYGHQRMKMFLIYFWFPHIRLSQV
jgi:hypothetical protein